MAIGDGIKTCWVCGGPLDEDGARCLMVNEFFHGERPSDYCPRCPNKLPCEDHGTTEHIL
jgi:hypothetical protein